jgi:hypothetical protein
MPRVALALAALLLIPAPAAAAPATPAAAPATPAPAPAAPSVYEPDTSHFTVDGQALPVRPRRGPARRALPGPATPPVGTTRDWLGIDYVSGRFYPKTFTLRAVGAHIEVWVAQDLAFPAGDCRTTELTPAAAQIGALVTQFDTVIYPRETAAFSNPPDRDGTQAIESGDHTGAGDRTVTLVDNIRDANYADPANPGSVVGTFSPNLTELFDRNVMTVDSYDWTHLTGAHPPNEPGADGCTNHTARPRLVESTFAHEWQHLLEYQADPDEETWVNEGLSDYAMVLTGYTDPLLGVYRLGFSDHLICFQGFAVVRTIHNWVTHRCGGAQNSLNRWNEGTPLETAADYGNAFEFMLYLHDRFGPDVLTRLHRDGGHHGLAAVAAALPAGTSLYGTLHAYQTAVLTDRVTGGLPSLNSTVNLSNPDSYDWPGAAPNGADYVRLRDAAGHYLRGADLRSVVFAGAATLPADPMTWTATGGALFSGNAPGLDTAAVTGVTVPATGATLRLTTTYGFETGFDFGYVSVSDDGGRTYVPVSGDRTGAGPLGPGLTGPSAGEVAVTYDLSAYAGKAVLLQFRYVSDDSVDLGGWAISGIRLGATDIPVAPAGFRSPSQIRPTPVAAWSARLVGMNATAVTEVPVRDWAELAGYDKVVAIVAYDEPTGTVSRYAPYSLTVNGTVQPGGA